MKNTGPDEEECPGTDEALIRMKLCTVKDVSEVFSNWIAV